MGNPVHNFYHVQIFNASDETITIFTESKYGGKEKCWRGSQTTYKRMIQDLDHKCRLQVAADDDILIVEMDLTLANPSITITQEDVERAYKDAKKFVPLLS